VPTCRERNDNMEKESVGWIKTEEILLHLPCASSNTAEQNFKLEL
jgi:hypothetical protein